MTQIFIRPSTEEDIDFLWDMLYEAIYIPEGEERPSRDILLEPEIAKLLNNWGNQGDFALIATDDHNNRLGAVWIRQFSENDKVYGFINEKTPVLGTALTQGNRGKGIGTVLLSNMIEAAKANGYDGISLSVDPNNPARRLYERLGFRKVGVAGTSWDMMVEL